MLLIRLSKSIRKIINLEILEILKIRLIQIIVKVTPEAEILLLDLVKPILLQRGSLQIGAAVGGQIGTKIIIIYVISVVHLATVSTSAR